MSEGPKVLVCVGRNYKDYEKLSQVLSWLNPSVVIDGGARGADYMASSWALENGVISRTVRADWAAHGKTAGPIRNKRMLSMNPDIVVAFPGGTGTADMVRRAKAVGTIVVEVSAGGSS